MPAKGSCVCGEWTYEYTGDPAAVAVCHCIPCRKTAGTNGSFNFMIPQDNFKKLSGTDFKYNRLADSGNTVHYRNCGKCGTIIVADTDSMPGIYILKAGTVDDEAEVAKHKPGLEIYRKNAPEWCTPWSCAAQKEVA
ncbi:hypothetical protein CLAFUW4_02930 [Fulvia fulva]|uniref:CENP-V/GFA domain-containing protein n=1 Tax=Passalora fulva TaxID=5499 RepID=A0A9Q8L976_PASFU|nr:uncharacterized protein CLAFUR5_02917 [Fulvia fulva]KAK4631809.1 hypothetical protein CLAFUR4_02923 [Fulvia fulva]KAK4633689.1 hypothetical protein CLAFUR0_02926 [Fulvia fulva]UJO13122.1 hypothetical protein CLAFUR5_02917 [Fulvia fulva]WPV11312.1 hypothetical protein CLAFUW4_02930 [Fulvia fulva]WPV26176.1 hypothetical protein CLAFUW7_02927 [Fulvia fulva]